MLNSEIQFNLFGRNWSAYWQVSEDNTKQYVRLRTTSKPRPTKEQYNAAMRYARENLFKGEGKTSMSVNFKRPYEWKGGKSAEDADFIRQNNMVYAWSESNARYEKAWWLLDEANMPAITPLVRKLREERPLPEGEWNLSDSYMAIDGSAVKG